MAEPGMNTGQRFGYGVLALLVFVAFTFGLLGGSVAGVGLLVLSRSTLLASPTSTPLPTATPTPILVLPTPSASPIGSAISEDDALVRAVSKVGPAVVTVITTLPPQRGRFGTTAQSEARGSGIIISKDGYIVTNNHVIENGVALSVILADGERRDARLIGADVFSDLAVIQISGVGLSVGELGDSSSLMPGQRVIAIGSALGDFLNTVTSGVISGLGRSVETDSDFKLEDLIQTDAAINEGNSGGPLIDTKGRVVGISTLIVGRSSSGVVAEGLGFAVAANTVREVAGQLIATGRVARPFLGIGYQAVTARLASYYGLRASTGILITDVSAKSPAAQASMQTGDIILKIGDQEINVSNPYLNALMHHRPGEKVKFLLNRNGQELTIEVTLGQREP